MKKIVVIIFLASSFNLSAQDSTIYLSRYDKLLIHYYRNGYEKDGNYFKFTSIDKEFKPELPSFKYLGQYKKSTTNQVIFSLISLLGTVGYLAALDDYDTKPGRFWAAGIVTIISSGFSIHYGSKARKNLQLAIKTRNREILSGY